MRILFAPDYRNGLPYQQLLAEALRELDVEVDFLTGYRRGLPLYRGTADLQFDALHLHWPETYFQRRNDLWDVFRKIRYPLDLALTLRKGPLFLTAHNLLPHNRGKEPMVFQNVSKTVSASGALFVHSEAARQKIIETFLIDPAKCYLIPYGDHAATMGPPIDRSEARERLGISNHEKICLIFGTISPYKGSDEIIEYWRKNRPAARLIVTGPVLSEEFAVRLWSLAERASNVELRLTDRWLDDRELRDWLCAVDCSVFNYREIFTSGAAALARSFGVPLLIPKRLTAADLNEPHPYVLRFDHLDTDFAALLEQALELPPIYAVGQKWRERTSWDEVARKTKEAYINVLGHL